MMKLMALKVLRGIAINLQNAEFYSLMCDEATDVYNVSHLVICIRWVDDDFATHDKFIELKDISNIGADSITLE